MTHFIKKESIKHKRRSNSNLQKNKKRKLRILDKPLLVKTKYKVKILKKEGRRILNKARSDYQKYREFN